MNPSTIYYLTRAELRQLLNVIENRRDKMRRVLTNSEIVPLDGFCYLE